MYIDECEQIVDCEIVNGLACSASLNETEGHIEELIAFAQELIKSVLLRVG